MELKIKKFEELTTDELYQLLCLRAEVFVVEQDCVYQDVDCKDQKAIHVLGYIDQQLVAYARLFKAGDYFDMASIGRVVVKKSYRRTSLGKELMTAAIKATTTIFNTATIAISAQEYLTNFYSEFGFKAIGESYLEDGIPHVRMIRN